MPKFQDLQNAANQAKMAACTKGIVPQFPGYFEVMDVRDVVQLCQEKKPDFVQYIKGKDHDTLHATWIGSPANPYITVQTEVR